MWRLAQTTNVEKCTNDHWPSEGGETGPPQGTNSASDLPIAVVFSQPPTSHGWDYVIQQVKLAQPVILIFDVHPRFQLTNTLKSNLITGFQCVWNWETNCAWYGAPQARLGKVWATCHKHSVNPHAQIPLLIDRVGPPETIREFLQRAKPHGVLLGDFTR